MLHQTHKVTASGTNGSFTVLGVVCFNPVKIKIYLSPLTSSGTFGSLCNTKVKRATFTYACVHTLARSHTHTHYMCIVDLCSGAGERQKFQSHVLFHFSFSAPKSSFCFFQCTFSQRFSASLLQIQELYFSCGYLTAI